MSQHRVSSTQPTPHSERYPNSCYKSFDGRLASDKPTIDKLSEANEFEPMSSSQYSVGVWLSAFAVFAVFAFCGAIECAAQTQIIEPSIAAIELGDLAVSGFSGTVLSAESLAPGVNPIDKTVINPDGAALRVFDGTHIFGRYGEQAFPPRPKFEFLARDIGQIFGLAFDDGRTTPSGVPNLYAAATSAYGLQIVAPKPDGEGTPIRLKNGVLDARFMDGQFGSAAGGSPGSIWKIDGTNGTVSLLADTAFSGVANSGPGLGSLAFDPLSRNLYASDLDTGHIHRFALNYNAADMGQFDHGLTGRPAGGLAALADDGKLAEITSQSFKPADPATWGFTQKERRVHALAAHAGRLYYSVADGPTVWSVGLAADGGFAGDARLEVVVTAERPLPITGIVFDRQGRMILAQRGAIQNPFDYARFVDDGASQVLRYTLEQPNDPATAGLWNSVSEEYAVGLDVGNRASAGGLATQYALGSDGSIDLNACDGTIAIKTANTYVIEVVI